MRHPRARTALAATCLFIAGFLAGGVFIHPADRPPVSAIGTAFAQTERTPMDPNMLAIAMGVASVAVDAEAAALRINELTDRLGALEHRVQALEKPGSR